MTPPEMLAIANTAVALGKSVAALLESKASIELKEKVAELREQLVTLKGTLVDVIDENRNLQLRISELEKPSLKRRNTDGLYFEEGYHNPHCAKCYEVDGLKVGMQRTGQISEWQCTNCNRKYEAIPPIPYPDVK